MPHVNINFEPVPDVTPTEGSSASGMHIQANPAAFGAPIGTGLEKLGQGIEQSAEAGFQALEFHDTMAAQQAANTFIDQQTKIEYGDPGKTVVGPDGKPMPDTGYLGTVGSDALYSRQAALQRIEQVRQDGLNGLQSAKAREIYDNETRRYYAMSEARIGAHADQQQKVWGHGVAGDTANIELNAFVRTLDTPEQTQHGQAYIQAKVQQAQILYGNDPQAVASATQNAKRDLLEAHVRAMAVKDPAGAMKLLQDQKDIAGVKYDDMFNYLKARSNQQTGDEAAQRALTGARTAAPSAAVANVPGGYLDAIKREEGFDPVPRWDVKQWTVGYGTRASGPNERPSAQELDQRFNTEITKAANIVDSVNPNLDPGTRAALTSLTYNTGDAWTHSGLGERVRAGDMAGAKQLFLQYGNVGGQPNAAVEVRRQREASWFGGGQAPGGQGGVIPAAYGGTTPAGPLPSTPGLKMTAMQNLLSDPSLKDNPEAFDAAYRKVSVALQAQEIAENQNTKAQKEASDAAASNYIVQMETGLHSPGFDFVKLTGQITRDPNLQWETKARLLDRVSKFSGEEERIGYGPGFFDAKSRILSQPGTAGHIGSVDDILNLPDNAVTRQGMHELVTTFQLHKKDDQASLQEAKHAVEQGVMLKMVRPDEGGGFIKDIKGQQMFNGKFLPMFNQAYSKWVADGKDPYEFLRDDKKIQGLMELAYPRAQRNADALSAQGQPVLPPTPSGVTDDAWKGVVTRPPTLADGGVMPADRWAGVLQKLLADPSPKTMAALDKHLGDTGLTAMGILKTLNPAAALAAEKTGNIGVEQPAKPATLMDQTKQEFPILNKYDIQYKFVPGGRSGSEDSMLESWPPGETGAEDFKRPGEFPVGKFGVEVFDPKTRPLDVLADVVSHHLINVDPKIKQFYSDFVSSITPHQEEILKDQYQYAKEREGEKRSFDQWKKMSGLPAFFRGYPFQQWPAEFNQHSYTSTQRAKLDEMMAYLRGKHPASVSAGQGAGAAVRSLGRYAVSHQAEPSATESIAESIGRRLGEPFGEQAIEANQ